MSIAIKDISNPLFAIKLAMFFDKYLSNSDKPQYSEHVWRKGKHTRNSELCHYGDSKCFTSEGSPWKARYEIEMSALFENILITGYKAICEDDTILFDIYTHQGSAFDEHCEMWHCAFGITPEKKVFFPKKGFERIFQYYEEIGNMIDLDSILQ